MTQPADDSSFSTKKQPKTQTTNLPDFHTEPQLLRKKERGAVPPSLSHLTLHLGAFYALIYKLNKALAIGPEMKLRRKKPEDSSDQQAPHKEKSKGKPKGLEVGKFEVSEDKIKFFVAKGLSKKQWVIAREIPVAEVEHIESVDNELTVTSKGIVDSFHTKDKTGSFTGLVEQVNAMLEEQHISQEKTSQANERTTQRRTELLSVIDRTVHTVDLSFDVLIGLQDKRINWQQIENSAKGFSENLNFTGQTLPPLSLEYTKITSAARAQVPKDASNGAFNILKATYRYFDGLKPEEDIMENSPNFQTTKNLVLAYFLLNDLLLGRFVGDENNAREIHELDVALQSLAEANFIINAEALKGSISLEDEKQTVIDGARAVFKEQLKYL
ncbi:MAG: hypothetical protein ABSF44_13935 [Candidatus Bathyarchaeia archaeon]